MIITKNNKIIIWIRLVVIWYSPAALCCKNSDFLTFKLGSSHFPRLSNDCHQHSGTPGLPLNISLFHHRETKMLTPNQQITSRILFWHDPVLAIIWLTSTAFALYLWSTFNKQNTHASSNKTHMPGTLILLEISLRPWLIPSPLIC